MTDYWKSYSKKYCDICKCWYADNKISSERHEMGARHKVMVQQKLRESSKKAKDKELKDHDLRMTLLSMEQAAKASMSSKNQKGLPSMPDGHIEGIGSNSEKFDEKEDIREELREQKRKLVELKKSAKRSQFWVDDQPEEEEELESDEIDGILCWVQGVTETGLRYYWHIFSGETRWDQPKRFFTSEEYAEKYTEIAAIIASKNQSVIKSGTDSNDFESNEAIAPSLAPQLSVSSSEAEATHEFTRKKERKRRWDNIEESKVPEELVKIEIKPPELIIQPTEIITTSDFETIKNSTNTTYSPYGPWVPVKKEIPKPEFIERPKEKLKKIYDDLPEQNYGPGTSTIIPEELLEVATIDKEELLFKQKQLPEKKKICKNNIVGFRRPTGNLANKSLRNNKTN